MTLSELVVWVKGVPQSCRKKCVPWPRVSVKPFKAPQALMDLGLGYLTLDRSASTLSTGERQRMQLARAVRNRTTGVLYVLDEPPSVCTLLILWGLPVYCRILLRTETPSF